MTADGFSHVETIDASGSSLAYALTIAAFFALMFGLAWMAVHGGPALLHILQRGRAYRRRMRAARHRSTPTHLTFRKAPLR